MMKPIIQESIEDALDIIFSKTDTCNICQKPINGKPELSKHMQIVHKQFNCDYCNFKTNSKTKLQKHWTLKCNKDRLAIGKSKGKYTGKQTLINDFFNRPKWKPNKHDQTKGQQLREENLPQLPPIGKDLIPNMITFYVDDGFVFGKALPKGMRYNRVKNCLEMSTAQLELDKNTPPDIRMANIFLAIGNTIDKDIQLTAD